MNVPVVSSGKNAGAAEILKRARNAFDRRIPSAFTPDAALVGKGRVSLDAKEVEACPEREFQNRAPGRCRHPAAVAGTPSRGTGQGAPR